MLKCGNNVRGCTRKFNTSHQMSVHSRGCCYKRISKRKKSLKTLNKNPTPDIEKSHSSRDQHNFFQINEEHIECDPFKDQPNYNCSDTDTDERNPPNVNHDNFLSEHSKHEDISAVEKFMILLARIGRKTGKTTVNGVIQVMKHPSFSLQEVRERCGSLQDCIKTENNHLHETFQVLGFNSVTVKDSESNIICDVYMRSALNLLKTQIRGGSSAFFNPSCTGEKQVDFSHPVNSAIGKEGVNAIISKIKGNLSSEVLWLDEDNSNQRSFVGLLQLYSDKTRTSLKKTAFQFYPFHLTLMNLSEEYRRSCIVNGLTTLAFLPTKFYVIEKEERIDKGVNRALRLRMLHQCLGIVLKEIKDYGIPGINCLDKNENQWRCHPCIANYCSDLPEAKDLTFVKNGNGSVRNCHRCMAETKLFNTYTTEKMRNGRETTSLINRALNLRKNGNSKQAEEVLAEYSLVEQQPFLKDFPFTGVHKYFDIHGIFSFEPLHTFHLGISKYLKQCISTRLKSEVMYTDKIPTKRGNVRSATFKTVRHTILVGVNRMMAHIQATCRMKGLRIDFSNCSSGDFTSGLYNEREGLMGMLEGKDYRNVDMVFPFLGMYLDRCCNEEFNAPQTKLFTLYVEIMEESLGYNNYMSDATINKGNVLERKIKEFKKLTTNVYSEYHASEFRTEKFHQLDHIKEDIMKYGGLTIGDSGLYEHSHTYVKAAYRSGSKRKQSAMQETVSAFFKENRKGYIDLLINEKHSKTSPSRISNSNESTIRSNLEALKNDCAALVRHGKCFNILELEKGHQLLRKRRFASTSNKKDLADKLLSDLKSKEYVIQEILYDLGEEACRMLARELRSSYSKYSDTRVHYDFQVLKVASGYVSGIPTPTLKEYNGRWNKILVRERNYRQSQRFVAERGFYNSHLNRQDNVLLQCTESENSDKMELWVGKLLGLFRLSHESECTSQKEEQEMAFVQYYDVVRCSGAIESALSCIKLKWANGIEETKGKQDSLPDELGRKWYSMVPITAIRGVVHVIRGDYGLAGRCIVEDMDLVPWQDQYFYINRFFFDSENIVSDTKDVN